MSLRTIDSEALQRVVGGADASAILNAIAPIAGVLPKVGPIAAKILPMVGNLVSTIKGAKQPAQAGGYGVSAIPNDSPVTQSPGTSWPSISIAP